MFRAVVSVWPDVDCIDADVEGFADDRRSRSHSTDDIPSFGREKIESGDFFFFSKHT